MRFISIGLALLLAFAVAACGGASNTPPATTSAAATTAAPAATTAAETTTEAAAEEEATTAAAAATTAAATTTAAAATTEAATEPAGREQTVVTLALSNAGWPDMLWKELNDYKLLQDELGITLDFNYYTDEQFGVMLASGDLTDIVCPRQRFLPAIIENNLAMDLEPIIDNHIPNLKLDEYSYANELSKLFMGGPENKLYFLAVCIGPENANMSDTMSRGYALRWDLYKQLGYPEITNDADYIKIMQDMHALFPQTPDGLPVYAMGLSDFFQEWHQRGAFIREGTTGNFWTYNGYLYAASYETMELINGYTNPDSFHWVDMKFFNNLWNLGLLDPDSFTMTQAERGEKMKSMQYLGHIVRETNLYNSMLANDPNTDIAIVVIPSSGAVMGGNKLCPAGGMPTDSVFIYSGSRNWEKAAEVLNFYRDPEILRLCFNGVRGVSWDYDSSGKPYLTEKGVADRVAYPPGSRENRELTGIVGTIWDWTPIGTTGIHPDGFFFDISQEFEYRAMVLNPVYRDMAQHWGVGAPSEYYSKLVADGVTIDWGYDYAQVVAMGCLDIPMDIQRIMNNVNEITYRSLPTLVMAPTQAEFDAAQQQFLNEIAAANEDVAWQWCLETYNAAKAKVDPIFAEARATTDAKLNSRR